MLFSYFFPFLVKIIYICNMQKILTTKKQLEFLAVNSDFFDIFAIVFVIILFFSFLSLQYWLLNLYKNKNPAARTVSRRRDFLTKKGISTANPSYVLRKCFFLISYIYYTRFSGGRKFLSDFLSVHPLSHTSTTKASALHVDLYCALRICI